MTSNAIFAEIAALAGDPARAGMLHALMDGRALTASELARMSSSVAHSERTRTVSLSRAASRIKPRNPLLSGLPMARQQVRAYWPPWASKVAASWVWSELSARN